MGSNLFRGRVSPCEQYMSDLQRIEHAKLHVEDLDDAVAWYTDVMGLVELERDADTVYLGAGFDDNFDMAVTEGGTGVEHFAVRALDASVVDEYERRLSEAGVEIERRDGDEPGQEAAVRFSLPSGVPMEVVAVGDASYHHTDVATAGRGGATPTDLDHITVLTPDIQSDVAFLQDVAGLKVSDFVGGREDWEMVFTRCNNFHHDVALRESFEESPPHTSLHHLAWEFDSIDHIKLFLDKVTQSGVDIERGVGRHHAGDNLYAYFWEPGGNRFELSAEMAIIRSDEPEYVEDYETATVAWGPGAPESFREGSGLAEPQ